MTFLPITISSSIFTVHILTLLVYAVVNKHLASLLLLNAFSYRNDIRYTLVNSISVDSSFRNSSHLVTFSFTPFVIVH